MMIDKKKRVHACARAHVYNVGFRLDHLDHLDQPNKDAGLLVQADQFRLDHPGPLGPKTGRREGNVNKLNTDTPEEMDAGGSNFLWAGLYPRGWGARRYVIGLFMNFLDHSLIGLTIAMPSIRLARDFSSRGR